MVCRRSSGKQAFQWAKSINAIEDFAEDFMDIQPERIVDSMNREFHYKEWYSIVIDQTSPIGIQRPDLAPWLNLVPRN